MAMPKPRQTPQDAVGPGGLAATGAAAASLDKMVNERARDPV